MVLEIITGKSSEQADGARALVEQYDWIPIATQNFIEMKWVLPSYTDGREKFMERDERIKAELLKEFRDS